MLQRAKLLALGCLVLFGYFWTGAVAKLWLLTAHPAGASMPVNLSARAFRGQSLIGVDQSFQALMSVYGPVPLGPLLGPGAASFLEGLGAGLDPANDRYDRQRQRALERNLRVRLFNPWRNRARLELAGLAAFPRPLSPAASALAIPDRGEPAWVTVGLVDPDRWWVVRQPAGPDPARAEEWCSEVLAHTPEDAVGAQALALRASLAAERWDFRSQGRDLRELALEHPATRLAGWAAGLIAAETGWQSGELLPLYRHVMGHQQPAARVRLAPGYAYLQAQNGEVEAARATLRDALAQIDQAAKFGAARAPGDDRNLRGELTRVLRSLKGRADTTAPPPSPPIPPVFPVQSRLLAAGKPLPGIAAALVPLAEAFRCLPYPASADAGSPRAAGTYPPPTPRSSVQAGLALTPWNPDAVAFALRSQPALVSRSDAHGVIRWPGVPAGAYALFLRFGTWQLPGRGRHLAPLPTREPVMVGGGETVVPDIRFVPALRLRGTIDPTGVPSVRWQRIPGAARYRVALRDQTGASQDLPQVTATGSGAPGIDPDTVWWRGGLTGTSLQMTPAQFVGPAADPARRGLEAGRQYSWYGEALGSDDHVLATSETMSAPASFSGQAWLALRPPKDATGPRSSPPVKSADARPTGPAAFTSPFLEGLIHGENTSVVTLVERRALPQAATNGQGLPPRLPLRLPSTPRGRAAPPGGIGVPLNLPPQLLARLRSLGLPSNLPPELLVRLQAQMAGAEPRPNLPPRLRAQLQGGLPGSGPPPNLPPQLLAQLQARKRGAGPPPNLPPALLARLQAEMAAGRRPLAVRRQPGSAALVPVAGKPGTAARPVVSSPRSGAPPGGLALAPLAVELEHFGPGSLERWRSDSEVTANADTEAGLPVRQSLTLTPGGTPLTLPPGTRRISVRLAGGDAQVTVGLRNAERGEQTVALLSVPGAGGILAAPLPAGVWAVDALTVEPRHSGETRLVALAAEVIPASGLFGTAWKEGDRLVVRVCNLGGQAARAVLGAEGASPLAEAELGPGGQALLRLPLAVFPAGALPAALSLQWRGGLQSIPVR